MPIYDWVKTKEAADYLHVTRKTIWNLYHAGKLKHCHLPETFPGQKKESAWWSAQEIRDYARTSARAKRRMQTEPPDLTAITDWISAQEAADILHVDITRVRKMAKSGLLTARRDSDAKNARLWFSHQHVLALRHDPEHQQDSEEYDRKRRHQRSNTPVLTEEERAELRALEWLTVEEAARFLGIAPVTLCGHRAAGRIPAYRHNTTPKNRRMYFRIEDVEALHKDPHRQKFRTAWQQAFSAETADRREAERQIHQIEAMQERQGWNKPNYQPDYEAWPGGVW